MARYAKKQAAIKLDVSDSTIDRRIGDGTLRTEKEQHGRTHRVWMLLDDDEVDEATGGVGDMIGASPDRPAASDHSTEMAVLRERCARLEELAEYRRELLVESDARTQMLIAELAAAQRISESLSPALSPPPAPADRRRGLLGWFGLR